MGVITRLMFVWPPFLAVVFAVGLAVLAFQRRNSMPGAKVFAALMIALGLWSTANTIELFLQSPYFALRLAQWQYVAVVAVAPLWWIFISSYLGRSAGPPRQAWVQGVALWGIPGCVLALAWTNPWHGLVWRDIRVDTTIFGPLMVYDHGPAVFVLMAYAYLLLAMGIFRLLRARRSSPGWYGRQVFWFIVASCFPVLANAFYLTQAASPLRIDLTPIGFAFAGFLIVTNVYRRDFLKMGRVAYDALFHDMQDGTIIVDGNGYVVESNQAAARLLHRVPPASVIHFDEWLHDMPDVVAWRQDGDEEQRIPAIGEDDIWLEFRRIVLRDKDASGRRGELIIVRDVSEAYWAEVERESLREQLIRQEKMESVGRLAGGVAHDFNNMLQGILGFSDLLLADMPADSPWREDVDEIRKAAGRAATLTGQLLSFSRRQIIVPTETDINKLLREMHDMLERQLGDNIRFSYTLDDTLPAVHADSRQLQQVVTNLFVNARNAMPEGGELELRTELVEVGPGFAKRAGPHVDPGQFVCLTVRDTGCGIPSDAVPHLFEPFYTTRPRGEGVGMGLAVAYGVVHQHRGWIDVASDPGKGSCFSVYLPALPAKAPVLTKPTSGAVSLDGEGTLVLLVEDEPTVRLLAVRTLEKAGYRIVSAANVVEAKRCFNDHVEAIDVVFSDVVLPDGNGVDLLCSLRRIRPDLPVLLTSGYTDDRSLWTRIQEYHWRLLLKPYKTEALLQTLREVVTEKTDV